jgi:hypothetical protein
LNVRHDETALTKPAVSIDTDVSALARAEPPPPTPAAPNAITVGKLDPLALDDGQALAADDEEPLVGAVVPVLRPALGVAGPESHLCRLGMAIAEQDAEALAEPEVLVLHGAPCWPSPDPARSCRAGFRRPVPLAGRVTALR